MAKAVILPVCMGVVRPFSPSLMSERHKIASELFQLPPADLYRLPKRPSAPSGTPVVLDLLTEPSDSGSDGEAEAEAENEEVHTHGDASSTATVGSNPIPFFSDQVSILQNLARTSNKGHNRIHLHPKETVRGPKCSFCIPTIHL